eukprot:m.301564 g.301564  ORF g.301564 m.301564 type:complete len:69 (+) comp15879_c0_seq50:581-787(+)
MAQWLLTTKVQRVKEVIVQRLLSHPTHAGHVTRYSYMDLMCMKGRDDPQKVCLDEEQIQVTTSRKFRI